MNLILAVRAALSRRNIHFKCADDGAGFVVESELPDLMDKQSKHHGILNVHQRIVLHFGEGYGVSVQSAPGQGTKTTIRMPFRAGRETP